MRSESTIVSEGFNGGTRGAPIMPRDVSLSDSKCRNTGQKLARRDSKFRFDELLELQNMALISFP